MYIIQTKQQRHHFILSVPTVQHKKLYYNVIIHVINVIIDIDGAVSQHYYQQMSSKT